ncbi:Lysophospholipid acyltransferase 7 [Halocaridina rubra]|uniref:Lysophospholipid acyltransferase 7 n=1 Tax=Halocaridina rubra TaxID=373956 RepID=A0AAN8X2W1_HALRR
MNFDDIVYLSLLIGCIAFGEVYRKLGSSEARKWIGTIVGLGVVLVVSGIHILHPIFLTVTNICILHFLDKRLCHVVSFVWSFSYLLFFRVCHYLGLEMPPAHTNAILMMLTLKYKIGTSNAGISLLHRREELFTVPLVNSSYGTDFSSTFYLDICCMNIFQTRLDEYL